MDKSNPVYKRLRQRLSDQQLTNYADAELVALENLHRQRDSILYHLLEHFDYVDFTPSRNLLDNLNKSAYMEIDQRQLTDLLAAISNEYLVVHSVEGGILIDYRLLEKHPDSGRQSATYRRTMHGEYVFRQLHAMRS